MRLSANELLKRGALFWFGVSSIILGALVLFVGVIAPGFIPLAYVETEATVTEVEELKDINAGVAGCVVSYTYTAPENTYFGTVVKEREGGWLKDECAEAFPVGSTFPIYYNSLSNNSTIDMLPSAASISQPLLITGAVVALVGAGLLSLGIRRVRRRMGLVPVESASTEESSVL